MEEFKKTTNPKPTEENQDIDLEEQEKRNREKKTIDEVFDENKTRGIKEADSIEKLMELIEYRKMSLGGETKSNEKAKEYYDRLEWLVQNIKE